MSSFLFLTSSLPCNFFFFFFNDTATTEIYTLSLHDALPIYTLHHEPERPAARLIRIRTAPKAWLRRQNIPCSGDGARHTLEGVPGHQAADAQIGRAHV